jgi:hypothetical protein
MRSAKVAILSGLLAAGFLATVPAEAAKEFGRGNIQAVDWGVMQVAVKTPQGGVLTYKVAPNAEVKFTDGAADFPNPTYRDLAPPMYIYFQFEDQTISFAEVREVGSAPRRSASASASTNEQSRQVMIRILKINSGGANIDADVAGRRTNFLTANRQVLSGYRENDLVEATVVRRNSRDTITALKPGH